jgi:hypothetical protein
MHGDGGEQGHVIVQEHHTWSAYACTLMNVSHGNFVGSHARCTPVCACGPALHA